MKKYLAIAIGVFLLAVGGFTLTSCGSKPMKTVDYVDLPRFMGDWYVLAHIPASTERDAFNAIESYELGEGNKINTTYTFNKGGFDGERKEMNPTGFVKDTDSNADWRMQFFWPIRLEYLIVHLDEGYTQTIIGRSKRDYAWIMARTPSLPDGELDALIAKLGELGYDIAKVRIVPQQWDDAASGPGEG